MTLNRILVIVVSLQANPGLDTRVKVQTSCLGGLSQAVNLYDMSIPDGTESDIHYMPPNFEMKGHVI